VSTKKVKDTVFLGVIRLFWHTELPA